MVKAGIIGLGKMGLSHCSILNAHPEVNLLAACDSSKFLLEAIKKYTRIKCYTDYKEMIGENEFDCLVIATPTKYHFEMVKYALNKNINVFVEKPFSLTLEDSNEMYKLANKNMLVNQVGYHNRFLGTFKELKRLLDNNVIGEVYHFLGEAYGPVVVREKSSTWRSEKDEGGGCLYDYASHVINLINLYFGEPSAVAGTFLKKIYSKEVEDAVYSILIYEKGFSGILSVNWSEDAYRKMSTQISVFGKKGKIIADATECRIYLKEENTKENLKKGWTIKYITDVTEGVNFYLRGEEYSSQIDYFIDHVKNKKHDNINSFESALQTEKVIDLLFKNGKEV
ncbi:MAG: Gfo/Idh/MocA family oxidoreductase [Bacteroidota bacterium]|nr:Gfo/Idh/MocA family oxidoreductase [Bacteroidota bacterium]